MKGTGLLSEVNSYNPLFEATQYVLNKCHNWLCEL